MLTPQSLNDMDPQLGVFILLPAEIRSTIFEYAVSSKQLMTHRLDRFQQEYYTSATQPALTRVSRQIRTECLPLFYERNDFILHTESPQTLDASRWLQHNKDYLSWLRRISLWIRHVPSGAIQVTLARARRHDPWIVVDDWKWITVVRKPHDLSKDVDFLLAKLRELVPSVSNGDARSGDYFDMISRLRTAYVKMKAS